MAAEGVGAAASAAGMSAGTMFALSVGGAVETHLSRMDFLKNIFAEYGEELGANKGAVDMLNESYSGLGGTISYLADTIEFTYYALTGQIDKAKEAYAVTEEVKNSADKAKDSVSKIYDTKAAESLQNMKNDTESLKESLNHIADTKAAEGLKKMKESAGFKEISQNAKDLETAITTTQKTVDDATMNIGQDWTDAQTEVSTAMDSMKLDVSDGMTQIQTSVTQSTDEIMKSFDTIKDGMTKEKWTFDGVSEGLKETFRRAKEGIKSEWNQIANTLNGNHTVGTSSININLPKFANGGFPRENGIFMANSTEMVGRFSNGKTAVANNEQITDGIARAVFNAMSMAGSNNNPNYINNTIMVDGMVLARTTTKAQNDMNRRYSPSMA